MKIKYLLPMLLCLASAAHADLVPSLEALRATLPPCDGGPFDFEAVPFGTYVGALPGVSITTSTQGAFVDDDAGGTRCHGNRCLRVPLLGQIEVDEPPWVELRFDPPVPAFSLLAVDVGTGDPGQQLLIAAYAGDQQVEAHALPAPGNDQLFVGIRAATLVDRVRLTAPVAGDGFGFDDLWFPARQCHDLDGDGFTPFAGDCDDERADRAPNLVEQCDGVDNDCRDGVPDRERDWHRDGWLACDDPDGDGQAEADGDCAPQDHRRFAGAAELCDGIDNDCDGEIGSFEHDDDRDGWLACEDPDKDGVTEAEGDCAPHDPLRYPGAAEACDGLDNDCDGVIPDHELNPDRDPWLDCEDPDGDGVTEAEGDCRPLDPWSYPGAPEACDGVDNDCDGVIDTRERDDDRDGWLACEDPDGDGQAEADGDCAPHDTHTYRGATEICDGLDNGCTGHLLDRELDLDRDGWLACEDPDGDGQAEADGDCAPHDPQIYSGAPELCDGLDNDCDGVTPANEADGDRDGYRICEGDCADDDPVAHPLATERENGFDDNCDGYARGGPVGCDASGRSSDPHAVLIALGLLGLLTLLRRRLRASFRWIALLVLPAGVIAASVGGDRLEDFAAVYDDPAYLLALAASDHGTQVVIQLREEALERLVLDQLAQGDWLQMTLADVEHCIGLFCPHFDVDLWAEDVDVRLGVDNRATIDIYLAGSVRDDAARLPLSEVAGPLRVELDLAVEGACPDDLRIDLHAGPPDASGVTFTGLLGAPQWSAAARQQLADAVERYVQHLPPFELDAIVCRNPVDAAVLVGGVKLRTVTAAESDTGRAFLMLGYDLLPLPICAADGPPLAFKPDAFDRFSADLIAPDRDVAFSLSARLLRAWVWRQAFLQPADTLGDEAAAILAGCPAPAHPTVLDVLRCTPAYAVRKGLDWARETHFVTWGGFKHAAPIADAALPGLCDGDTEGSFVLDPATPNSPRLHAEAGVWGKKDLPWPISDVSMKTMLYADLRLYADVHDPEEPVIGVELIHRVDQQASCTASCFAKDDLRATRALFEQAGAAMTSQLGTLPPLSFALGDGEAHLDHFRARPAALVFSGTLASTLFGELRPPPAVLPPGTILGLEIGEEPHPNLAAGFDSTERGCPPGALGRSLRVGPARWFYCEVVDAAAAPLPLPAGAWCGLSFGEASAKAGETLPRAPDPACVAPPCETVPVASSCLGHVPRESCPDGFKPQAIWLDRAYAEAVAASGARFAPQPPNIEAFRDDADLVTCVKVAGAAHPDLPGGLVLGGGVVGLSVLRPLDCPADLLIDRASGIRPADLAPTAPGSPPLPLAAGFGHLRYCTTPARARDDDADGLDADAEALGGFDPTNPSTSGDALPDAVAAREGLDPHALDTDGDQLSDFAEVALLGTDPLDPDTDGDGLPDGYERIVTLTDPLEPDTDGDGVLDGEEEALADLRPADGGPQDSDGDGLPDGFERWVTRTDPLAVDTDGDGQPDAAIPAPWYGGDGPRRGDGQPAPDDAPGDDR